MVVPPPFTLKATPLPGAWGAEITGVRVSFRVNRSPSLSSGFASEQLSDLEQVACLRLHGGAGRELLSQGFPINNWVNACCALISTEPAMPFAGNQ